MRGDHVRKNRPMADEVGLPPHAWGHEQLRVLGMVTEGLPPHAWGPLQQVTARLGGAGSTPTCVGTTCSGIRRCRPPRVYPHMRGDHRARTPSCP